MQKLYYFLSGLLAVIIVAVNIRSQGNFMDIQVAYAVIWLIIELISNLIQDIKYIIEEVRNSDETEEDEMCESGPMQECRRPRALPR